MIQIDYDRRVQYYEAAIAGCVNRSASLTRLLDWAALNLGLPRKREGSVVTIGYCDIEGGGQ
jgi:hypothetical protein